VNEGTVVVTFTDAMPFEAYLPRFAPTERGASQTCNKETDHPVIIFCESPLGVEGTVWFLVAKFLCLIETGSVISSFLLAALVGGPAGIVPL
jgi:hypothetical protein